MHLIHPLNLYHGQVLQFPDKCKKSTKNREQVKGSRTSILFGTAISVIKDGAYFNKYILFFHQTLSQNNMCAYVAAEFCFHYLDNCEWKCAMFFSLPYPYFLDWGLEPGTASIYRKWTIMSKGFKHDFITKFKYISFHIVSASFNVSKLKRNISVLCPLIFPNNNKMGFLVGISLHHC